MQDSAAVAPRVVVAVATFRRPDGLARVLPLIDQQARQLPAARVVVVDNDPDGAAAAYVRPLESSTLRYVHEPLPGIASARNRALAEAADDHLLVFIDDDETPRAGWLAALVETWDRWRSAVVTGPVHPVFELPPGAWVLGSGVFAPVRRQTGELCAGAASNNVLYDLAALRRHGAAFDEEFGLSGGSDTMLAHWLRDKGEVIRWCAEAAVDDYIPVHRTTRAWIRKRTVRTSNTWARMQVCLSGSGRARAGKRVELALRGAVRLTRGLAVWPLHAVVGNDERSAAAVVDAASGLGLVAGATGMISYEYRRSS